MKRLMVLASLTATLVVGVSPVSAAPKAKAASPQAQINALKKQVATLQKQVKTLYGAANALFAYNACLTASVADEFQSTWIWTNKGTNFPNFPSTSFSTPVDDKKGCSDIQVTRALPNANTPPTTAIFQNLINWLSS